MWAGGRCDVPQAGKYGGQHRIVGHKGIFELEDISYRESPEVQGQHESAAISAQQLGTTLVMPEAGVETSQPLYVTAAAPQNLLRPAV